MAGDGLPVEGTVFEVEDIVQHKIKDGKDFFLIKWKGYKEASWEPDDNIGQELKALKKAAKERSAKEPAKAKNTTCVKDKEKSKEKGKSKAGRKSAKKVRNRRRGSTSCSGKSEASGERKGKRKQKDAKKTSRNKSSKHRTDKSAERRSERLATSKSRRHTGQKRQDSSGSSYSSTASSRGKRPKKDSRHATAPNAGAQHDDQEQQQQAMQQWHHQQQQQQQQQQQHAAQYHQQMQHWHHMQQWQAYQYQQQQAAARHQHEQHQMMVRQQEEERRQQDEEARKRRIEEQNRRRAQELEENKRRAEATSAIMKVIQKVRVATPESLDELKRELEDVFSRELEFTGAQREQMLEHKAKALESAQSCIEKILALRQSKQMQQQAVVVLPVAPPSNAVGFFKARPALPVMAGDVVAALAPLGAPQFSKAAPPRPNGILIDAQPPALVLPLAPTPMTVAPPVMVVPPPAKSHIDGTAGAPSALACATVKAAPVAITQPSVAKTLAA